jgi:hypothetical protein
VLTVLTDKVPALLFGRLEGAVIMRCRRCQSEKLKAFNGELAIHFPGWEGLNKPLVWAFPEMLVCMDCGFVEFELPAPQLAELNTGAQSQANTQAA